MCGRYTLTNPEDVAARFGLGALTETRIEPRFNMAPSQAVPVIVAHDDQPTIELMRWGLQPAWMRDDGGPTCVIITTAANEVLAPIHDRMPVILDRSREANWLDPDLDDPRAALASLQPVPPDMLEAYPVASLVSSVRNDGPDLIEPLPGAPKGAPRLL